MVVYRTGDLHRAEMARQMIEVQGIKAVVLNQKDSSYLFGVIKVLVMDENRTTAKKLLKEF